MAHLLFKNSGNHYTWRKVTTTVHNIIVGKLWVDHHGEMDIVNHKNGDKCHLKYYAYSYFSSEKPRKVIHHNLCIIFLLRSIAKSVLARKLCCCNTVA